MMFFPAQQELDCINDNGDIIGKIAFDGAQDEYVFSPASEDIVLSAIEEATIAMRIVGLKSGKFSIPMQDDD